MPQVEYSEKDYQRLFEQLSDAWGEGILECDKISHLGMDLAFRYERPTHGRSDKFCRIQYVDVGGREFVSITPIDDFQSILVSPVISAILAICEK